MKECRKMALRYFTGPMKVEHKSDLSPVTLADRKIEEFLRREITRVFPKDGILGEEFGFTRESAKSYWTIDPIDGTRAFSRGLPSWGILAARVENGCPVVGACDLPVLGTFIGGTTQSAYERTGKTKISFKKPKPVATLKQAVIFHGGSNFFIRSQYRKAFEKIVSECYLERAYGDCYAYLWVLRGHADMMLDLGVKEWDLAPFAVLAEATGRVLVNFGGKSDFKSLDTIFGEPGLARIIVSKFQSSR